MLIEESISICRMEQTSKNGGSGTKSGRLVQVEGPTRVKRGEELGKVIGEDAQKIYELKLSLYKPHEGMLEFWDKIADASRSFIQRYAPVTWDEMQGMAKAGKCSLDVLLKLATEYEMLMANGHFDVTGGNEVDPGKCTGFASTVGPNGVICGQSNDENPNFWFNADLDVLIHSRSSDDSEPSTLIYTHPGYPGYMGMNSAGVCVLWQYIDNGERCCDKGLPTCVILKEILQYKTAAEAVEWLRSVPRTVPNNYMLCDQTEIFNVECSPTRFTVLTVDDGDFVHANHCVFDHQMMDNDVGLKHSLTSPGRYKALRERLRKASPLSVEAIKKIYATAPLLRTDGSTLATMIFQPALRTLDMRFKGDSRNPQTYKTYSIPEHEWQAVENAGKRKKNGKAV